MNLLRIFLILLIYVGFSFKAITAQGVQKIIIDPGHGGKDPGAIGVTGLKEKDVVLNVSQMTAKYLRDNFPDIEVIMTRNTDVFLELHERSSIANNHNAYLFISIHANAASSKSAYGAETFVLGLHKSEANLEVAKRENAVIELEDNHQENYAFNPNSPEGHIMMSMAQNAYLDQSILLASAVQDEFTNRVHRHNRGVRQAGFYVLYKTTMPSILIELGFLSNAEEEKFLRSAQGQDYLASAIYRAVKEYKILVDGKFAENEANRNNNPTPVTDKGRIFKIQVYASKSKAAPDAKVYQDFGEVVVEPAENGVYRYMVNKYNSYEAAASDLLAVTKKGYKGAYIVAYEDGKRVQVYDVTSTN